MGNVQSALTEMERGLEAAGMPKDAAKEHIDKFRDVLEASNNDAKWKANAVFFNTALIGVGSNIARAGLAFKAQPPDAMLGSAELLKMTGTLFQCLGVAGRFGGPIGAVVRELLGLGAALLIGFAPEQEKVGEQLRKELREFSGEDAADTLAGVLYTLHLQEADLKKMKPNSHTWNDVLGTHSIIGELVPTWMGKAEEWLRKKDNQAAECWPYVWEASLRAMQQYLENFMLGYNALEKPDSQKAMSDTEQDRRIEDLDRANSVLKTVCEEYASFIADVRPLALNHGTVYHIGTSAKVYKRGMAVGDLGWDSLGGVSTRLSVAEDERIWTIGKGNWVWTGFGDEKNWKKTSITAEDIWVVKQGLETSGGKGSLSDIYTIEDGKFCWRVWDETIGVDARTPEPARWEKFVPVPGAPHALGGKKYTADGPLTNIKFQHVVATADGTVYLLGQAGGGNPLRVWYKSTYPYAVELVYPPTLADPLDSCRGIAINNDQFYVITKDKINCTDHEGITKPHEWKTIGGPTGTNKDWSYNQLFASEDGALLVTVNQKIYFWAGKGWEPNKDKASAVRLFRLPVLGWELFEAVEDLVEVARKLPSGISTGVVS